MDFEAFTAVDAEVLKMYFRESFERRNERTLAKNEPIGCSEEESCKTEGWELFPALSTQSTQQPDSPRIDSQSCSPCEGLFRTDVMLRQLSCFELTQMAESVRWNTSVRVIFGSQVGSSSWPSMK